MKRKRIVVVWLLMAMVAVGTVNAQVSFIDQFGVGGSYIITQAKGDTPEGELFGDLHILVDYWIGAYVQNIDSAIYAGLRWDLDDLDVGAMWDYHFTNEAGFSLGAGVELFDDMAASDETNFGDLEPSLSPYVRVGAFLNLATLMKLGVDYTVKFNGKQTVGAYISFSSLSLISRFTNYMPIRRTSDHRFLGRWGQGDAGNGIELHFYEDLTVKIILDKDGEDVVIQEGTWSTPAASEEGSNTIYVKIAGSNVDQWSWASNRDGAQLIFARINGQILNLYRYEE